MNPPELLVFDLDGTLIDSSTDLCLSVNAMLRTFDRAELPFPTIASYIGDGASALVHRALAASGSASPIDADGLPPCPEFPQAYAYFIQYYREHKLDHTTLYPGVKDALRQMRESAPDVLMAVLTNKPVNPSREICRDLGVGEFFFQNYGGDSFQTQKPDPEGLTALIGEANAIRAMRSQPSAKLLHSQIVMIGDSGVDVQTARNSGVRAVGCTFGLAPESLLQTKPDLLTDQPSEWPSVLGFPPKPM